MLRKGVAVQSLVLINHSFFILWKSASSVAFFSLLFILFMTSALISQPKNLPDKRTFDTVYNEGKILFYETLKQNADRAMVLDKDRELLLEAEVRIPGLYEHLMNFYYFSERIEEGNFHSSFPDFPRRMAEEFIMSTSEISPVKGKSALKSLLFSTGYFSRKMTPIFRRNLRPLANRVKGQWALEDLKVRKVHTLSRGKGVKLAIIDSGVDPTIKEIRPRIVKWKDFLDGSKPILHNKGRYPFDWGGHGTSIASVVYQVAPKMELIIIRVTDDETMRTVPPSRWSAYLVAAGVVWAAENGADIINLSISFKKDFKQIREAVKSCWEKNIVVVTAMANSHQKQQETMLCFPASYPWTIAVGGVEKDKAVLKLFSYSSKGEYIDVVAPASGVVVERPSYLDLRQRASPAFGNSLAVPFVSGTAALILSAMDRETIQKLKDKPGALVETIQDILRETSSNYALGLPTPNPSSGYGLIDIYKAVSMAKNLKIGKELIGFGFQRL